MKSFTLVILGLFATMISHGQSASESYRTALSHYEAGEYELAIDNVDLAINLGKQGNYYKLRADCHHKMESFASALADYDFAEKRGCTDLDLYINRGICRISMGMYDQGEMDLWRHLEAFPEDEKALYYLGEAEYLQFNNKACLNYLNQAIEADPEYMDAYYLRGANYVEMGRMDLAEKDFEMCVELNPDFQRNVLNLAIINIENLQPEEALISLHDLHSEDEELMAEILYYKAEAHYALHNQEEACFLWQQAAELGDVYAEKNYTNVCEKGNGRHKKKKVSFATF